MAHTKDLKEAVRILGEVTRSIRRFDTYSFTYVPPVLDNSSGTVWRGDETHGLRKFLDKIFTDKEAYTKVRLCQLAHTLTTDAR